jgi:chorismate mutase
MALPPGTIPPAGLTDVERRHWHEIAAQVDRNTDLRDVEALVKATSRRDEYGRQVARLKRKLRLPRAVYTPTDVAALIG